MTSSLDNLTQINLDDLINALGIQSNPTPTRITRFVFQGAARRFAKQMIDFDSMAGTGGLAEGSAHHRAPLCLRCMRLRGKLFAGFLVPCFIQSSRYDRYPGPLRRPEP